MKITLLPGIQSISGSFKTKGGKRVIFTTRKAPTTNKECRTRMYIREPYKRSVPYSKAELGAQSLFTKRQAYVQNLRQAGDHRTLKELWKEAKEKIC